MNCFIHGINIVEYDFAGYTISQAEEALTDVLNIGHREKPVLVDGRRVANKHEFVLQRGQSVLFFNVSGWKGSGRDSDFDRLINAIEEMATDISRLANHFDPPPPNVVDTQYVASEMSVSIAYVGELARKGEIPTNCLVPGSGEGKCWKFYRSRITKWIASR